MVASSRAAGRRGCERSRAPTSKSPLVLGLLALAGACMTAPAPADGESGAVPRPCSLTVRFGSYAMGIDGGAAQSVERLLRADRAVASVERKAWGREGEYDLCARIARVSDAERLFGRIRPLLPAKPRGPITVTLVDGRSYSVPPQQ